MHFFFYPFNLLTPIRPYPPDDAEASGGEEEEKAAAEAAAKAEEETAAAARLCPIHAPLPNLSQAAAFTPRHCFKPPLTTNVYRVLYEQTVKGASRHLCVPGTL